MSKNTPEKLYDVRVVKRNLTQGLISEKEYNNQMKSLPDLEGEYEVIDLSDPAEVEETAAETEAETGSEADKVEVD